MEHCFSASPQPSFLPLNLFLSLVPSSSPIRTLGPSVVLPSVSLPFSLFRTPSSSPMTSSTSLLHFLLPSLTPSPLSLHLLPLFLSLFPCLVRPNSLSPKKKKKEKDNKLVIMSEFVGKSLLKPQEKEGLPTKSPPPPHLLPSLPSLNFNKWGGQGQEKEEYV